MCACSGPEQVAHDCPHLRCQALVNEGILRGLDDVTCMLKATSAHTSPGVSFSSVQQHSQKFR